MRNSKQGCIRKGGEAVWGVRCGCRGREREQTGCEENGV